MAPTGPFTSAAMAVVALLSTPFVWQQVRSPSGQERIGAAIDSLKVKLKAQPLSTASPKEDAPAPKKAEVPTRKAAQEVTKDPPASDEKWSSATPTGEVDSSSTAQKDPEPSVTTPPPKPKPSTETKKAAPSPQPQPQPQADAKAKLKEFLGPAVHHLEVNAIAFDQFCSGPLLREMLSVRLKAWGVLPHLEKLQQWAGSVAENVGLSPVAASAIMSLALIADFGLLGILLAWRLCKCCCGSRAENPRQKMIDQIKKETGKEVPKNGGGATPKRGLKDAKGGTPKQSPALQPATPPNSGSKKNRK